MLYSICETLILLVMFYITMCLNIYMYVIGVHAFCVCKMVISYVKNVRRMYDVHVCKDGRRIFVPCKADDE